MYEKTSGDARSSMRDCGWQKQANFSSTVVGSCCFNFPSSRSYEGCSTVPPETAFLTDCTFWMKLTTLDTFVVIALANDIVSAMVVVVVHRLYTPCVRNDPQFQVFLCETF
jgi:hypothetical protein